MDSKVRKILIFYNSAGHGHLKAAFAIQSALKTLAPNAVVEVFDALDFFPRWVKKFYVGSYVYMITKAHFLWSLSYAVADQKLWYPIMVFKRRLFNGLLGRRLVRKIAESRPDVVVSTHFMPAEICAHLKRRGKLSAKCVTVITDFALPAVGSTA